jgi:hypothetical protein
MVNGLYKLGLFKIPLLMGYAIFFLCQIWFYGTLTAQENTLKESPLKNMRKNTFFFEILGNGVIYSVNYDRIVPLKDKLALFVRIGGNEYHGKDTNKLSFNIIGALGCIYGGLKNFLDTGIGYTHFSGSSDRLIILIVGYRYQGPKGLVFRASPMYVYNTEKGDTFGNIPWIGLSFGYSF